ncbi:Laminin subunit alpha-1, partial [Operophtera brumata]
VCDSRTGQCKCKAGWTGVNCDSCAPGHYGTRCKPCHCTIAGTRNCNSTTCGCDQWGRCPCKENVVGDKCDECLEGTFGLTAENPSGCTACFCFGRVSKCTQASLTRAALHAAAPAHITLQRASGPEAITNMDQDSLLAIHTHASDSTITLPWPPVPVYMELDKRFLGDRVTSYGGSLRFRVEEEGGTVLSREVLARFPLVRIYSKNIVLDYYEHVPLVNGTHSVRFHESLWMVRGRHAASRGALMLALLRVERILLRATTRAPTFEDPVHALLLNVSLDTAIPGLSRTVPALGVELCNCPRGYAASSCQEPAVGFWMPTPTFHMTSVQGTIVIHMEGEAKPCHCNNRATQCDPDTGNCVVSFGQYPNGVLLGPVVYFLFHKSQSQQFSYQTTSTFLTLLQNCTRGTGGPRCNICAAGHYGEPDAPGGCQACPCPSRAANFADACAMTSSGRLQCLCKPGYTGVECESCAAGYYRYGRGCAPCACDQRGAVSPRCDALGRCVCRPHAAGDKCDMCTTSRTYLDSDGCRPCDNCTQTLLDSVEQLTSHLRTNANPDELSRIPQPFPAVREFSHNTSVLRSQLRQVKNDLAHSGKLDPSIGRLEAIEHKMFTDANKLKDEAVRRDKEAEYLSLESMSALEDVLKQRRKLGEQVEELDDFARGERHLSAHRALKEARRLLKQIKDMKVSDYVTGTNDVFDSANVQSTAVQEYNYRIEDTYRRLHKLVSSLDKWEQKAADLIQLAQTVWSADDAVTALQGRVKPRLAAVRDIGLRCRLVLEDVTNLSSHNLTDDIGASLLRTQTLSIRFPTLAAELEVLTLAAEEKEGILYNLTPAYREKYLENVQKHVKELASKASQYKSLFAGTRAAASLGVTAAQAWANVAAGVREAQAQADQATRNVAAAAALARGPTPMERVAAKGKVASETLRRRGKEVLAKAEELRTQLDHLRRGADVVSVVLRGVGWQERDLGARPVARVAETLAAADEQADRVYATTRALYDEASELRRKVRYSLRRQLAELQKHGDTALGAAQEHVSQIRGNTVRGAETAEALATAAAARARQHDAAAATLSPALRALRDKVLRAKHAADSISVSLTSVFGAAGCSRGYSVSSASGAVSRIALAVSFENTVRDGPLLSVMDNTQDKERYMKLTVDNKRLHMAWDLGAGEGIIIHPEALQPTHDDADHTSYRIEIERIWNTVHLKVERAGGSGVTASNSSSASAVSLTSSQLWLGAPSGVGLPGCVHALYSDDNTVGLWNFHEQPKEAQCTGCTQRWYGVSRGGEPTMVWFNGRGYAELRRSRLRPADRRQFSIAFTFRTRDENALLFSAVDVANNRSVSVILRACRVEFIVQYSGARLRIAAGGAHCDNRPKHVQAIRVFATNKLEKGTSALSPGSLRVNGEETLGSPSPPVQSAAALPDLSDATYWVGGAPPAGPTPLQPPLLGCLGALTVDREGYDLLDTPTRHGIEPRCGGRTFRSAILEGGGYIELPSPVFRRKAALGLSFRTENPDGLLLFRAPANLSDNEVDDDDGDDKHYLALVMVAGELEVIAAAGNGVLPGNAYPARSGGLYLGGTAGQGAKEKRIPEVGFKGTVADFVVDSKLIGLETALKWSKAQLGRGEQSPRAPPRAEPRALHALNDNSPCTKTPSFTVEAGAVKFGDARWSHAMLRTPRRAAVLAVTLQIRTYAEDGLLLLGSKNKPKHYTALVVRDGRLRLVVRGRKRKEVALPSNITTGEWK